MHHWWNRLRATWATGLVVLLIVAALVVGVTVVRPQCDAGEASSRAARRPPPFVSTVERAPALADDPIPVVTVPVDRDPFRLVRLDCLEQAHDEPMQPNPTPVFTVSVNFAGTTVTGGSATAPVQYIGGGGAILPA